MNLLLLNDSYFGSTIEEAGVQVLRVGPGEDNDVVVDPDYDDISEAIAKLPFRPDAILQVDSINRHVFFHGLEKIRAPRAFYAIDTPINDFWQQDFAHFWDQVWVDQPETVEHWRKQGITWANWLPLAADRNVFFPPDDSKERDLDVVFVGTMDYDRRPKRSAILHRLRRIADVTLVDGGGTRSVGSDDVANYYRRAKIVLNELLFDGVNLRTFEAMACGAVLLTEQGRGEDKLFGDNRELVTFNAQNLETVVQQLLDDPETMQQVGNSAAEVIRTTHSIQHRARKVLRELAGLKIRDARDSDDARARYEWGKWMASWKWEHLREHRHRAAEWLVDRFHLLDPGRQTIFLEGVGQAEQARDYLKQMLQEGIASPTLKPALASLALSIGDDTTAREALEMDGADRMMLHLATGERLLALEQDLTPGFNRMHAPRSAWTAFEHFSVVHSMDETSREALEGLDKVLMQHRSPEFMLPLWQRYHSRSPKNEEIERLLVRRAKAGYFIPSMVKRKPRDTRANVQAMPQTTRARTVHIQRRRAAG